jgi:hypothetical protein
MLHNCNTSSPGLRETPEDPGETLSVFVGTFLGIAAQFVLAIGVIFYVLPWMGLELAGHAHVAAESVRRSHPRHLDEQANAA